MSNNSIQIIYLNGPSSSGKTTLARALQDAFDEPFLHIGIDKIIEWMPEKINDWTGGRAPLGYSWREGQDEAGNPLQELQIGPHAQKIGKTFQEVVLALVKMGHRIIIDDVSFGKEQLDVWKQTLKNFPVLWVGINAPLAVLEEREKERSDRMQGSARGQFYKVHADATYDLEIDTHHASVSENVEKIKSVALSHPNPKPIIRLLQQKDIQVLADLYFPWSTCEETLVKWSHYLKEQEEGLRLSYIIEYQNKIAGYGHLLRSSKYPRFKNHNIPEINDVWIYDQYRQKGLGTLLITHMEELAKQDGYRQMGIGVGLYRDYGSAQKLYFRLGYEPDGHGVTYNYQPTVPGEVYRLDDELILWMTKDL